MNESAPGGRGGGGGVEVLIVNYIIARAFPIHFLVVIVSLAHAARRRATFFLVCKPSAVISHSVGGIASEKSKLLLLCTLLERLKTKTTRMPPPSTRCLSFFFPYTTVCVNL